MHNLLKVSSLLIGLMFFISAHGQQSSEVEAPSIKVHRYVSLQGWYVNSYILESEKGLVLIDAQLLKSDAKKLSAIIKSLDKPLKAVIVTHPHPDHFGGLPVLKDHFGDFSIIASKATADNFVRVQKQFSDNFASFFGNDAEQRQIMPSKIVHSGEKLNLAGIEVIIDDLGPGEAANNIVVYQPQLKALFTGDATMHHAHFYVGEGHSREVLAQFEYMKRQYADADILYTGHGEPARLPILDDLIEQVTYVREVTAEALSNPANLNDKKDHLTVEARRVIADRINKRYPSLSDFGFTPLSIINMNLRGVESELLNK